MSTHDGRLQALERVAACGFRWLEHARQAKAAHDNGQDDWYEAYAADATELMRALDDLRELAEDGPYYVIREDKTGKYYMRRPKGEAEA